MVYIFDEADRLSERWCARSLCLLSKARKERVRRQQNALKKRGLIVGALLLRLAMRREYPGEDPGVLRRGAFGKPYYSNGPCFNLSHRDATIVCAVSDRPVGVDVETYFSETVCDPAFFLSEPEMRYWRKHRSAVTLTQLWSLKEAAGKYRGLGLNGGLKATDMTPLVGFCGRRSGLWHENTARKNNVITFFGETMPVFNQVTLQTLTQFCEQEREAMR